MRCYGAEKGGRDWLHQLQDPVGNENAGESAGKGADVQSLLFCELNVCFKKIRSCRYK